MMQRSVGAIDAVARTLSLNNVVHSCNSAVAITMQWLQRDNVGLAIVRSKASRCIYAEHLFSNLGCFFVVEAITTTVCSADAILAVAMPAATRMQN